ncbi:Bifunctional aminoacyl-tRNA synthetase [Camponotus japonicus]
MVLSVVINSSSPEIELLIVIEIIKENKKDITVSWKNEMKGNAYLYDNDKLLAESSHEINRYFARTINTALYGGTSPCEKTQVDNWISFAIEKSADISKIKDNLDHLDRILLTRTWLVNKSLTLADIYIFCSLLNQQYIKHYEKNYDNITRWYKHIESLHFVKNSLSVIENSTFSQVKNVIPQKEKPVAKQTKTKKQEGKFIDLPGAEMSKVVVRFPPEASGYLHIGHAKAALLNQYYAETFRGKLIMRFDDTNPAKETVEFEEAILQDLKLLQIKPHKFTHTSDYFGILEKYCTTLIEKGMAFVDDTLADVMKQERDQRKKSKNRDNSVNTNLKLWHEMKQGTQSGLQCCVRAKIDYESTNGCLRDPTIYRCKLESHPRTGNKYKVYPTYDFACPIVDVIENVTHTLRTTEYHDRDAQFYWIIDALGLRRPYIWEYSRLNMTYTVLSKRKLTWFVNEGLVDGWDDPRMPTVRGILRRGMTIEGLKQFIIAQGSSKSVVFMEWDKIWAFNKKVIDPVAVRYTALDYDTLVTVNIVDAKEGWLDVQNHPKDPSKGTKKVRISPKILIEIDDAKALIVGQNATFINWGNLMIEEIYRDESDNIKNVKARLNLTDKNYKNTLKLTWIAAPSDKDGVTQEDAIQSNPVECYAVYFNHIMNVPVLGKDDDFKNFVAKDTRREVKIWGEVEMKHVKKGEIIQLQRKGFFICDVPYAPVSSYSLRQQPVILFHIPDGHMTTPSITLHIAPSASQNQQRDITQQEKIACEKTVKDKKTEFGSLKEEYKMISEEIKKQGDKVRNLKSSKADKSIIDQEVKILLSLKNDYKTATGEEWKPASNLEVTSKKKKEDAPKSGKMLQKEIAKSATNKDIDVSKTGTRLGLEAKKEENFFDWYSQVITKSGMIEYYDVSGCYILRPWSFAIWKIIKEYIDKEITALGVQECYFPIFVTRGVLEKEKTHIADFAPEVAWVTKCGESDLAEPVAIRPTSETVMYPAYAKWLRSDTELPLRLNQWNNVVRWEFKDPKPFLRTREFLWQEGHSAFATKAEADEEVLIILDIYAKVYEDLLAVPIIKGRKTEKEKFPGGDYTTTVEAFISTSGRAIQGATSHHLGQNFSKMFNIQVEGIAEGDEKTFVYQNSWGLTTRTIGVMIMVHGDDKGLVLPPCVASIQGIVIPCGITANMSTIEKELLQSECVKLVDELSKDGKFRVKGDFRNNRTPGWKFNHWELKGVPVRIELGPKDMKKNQVTFVRRDNLQRTTVNRDTVAASLDCLLKDIQAQLLCRAKKDLDAHIKQVENWSDFGTELNNKNLLLSPFCGEPTCEDNIKTDSAREDSGDEPGALSMGAKGLCIPFEQPKLTKPLDKLKCIHHSCKNKAKFYTLFGRSY